MSIARPLDPSPHARRVRRRGAVAAALVGLLVLGVAGGPAFATEVVQVRVGQHPEFTRVVFELDGPAGYRVEKRGSQLRVTLDARSAPRSIRSRGDAVKRVRVERAGDEAVAVIDLQRADLMVKEMILTSPSRIVLDVMRPQAPQRAVARAAPPKPAPKSARPPEPAKPVARQESAKKPVAPSEPAKPAVARAPAPAPAPTPRAPEPAKPTAARRAQEMAEAAPAPPAPAPPKAATVAPRAPAATPMPRVAEPAPAPPRTATPTKPAADALPPRAAVVEEPIAKPPSATAPQPKVIARTLEPEAAAPTLPAEEPAGSAADALRERLAKAAPAPPEPGASPAPSPAKPVAKATPAAPKPSLPAAPAAETPGGWMQSPVVWGAAAGALICALLVTLLLRRRQTLPNDLDVTSIAGAGDEDGGRRGSEGAGHSFMDGLFDDEADAGRATLPVPSAKTQAQPPGAGGPTAPPGVATEAVASGISSEMESLFDDLDETPEGTGTGEEAMGMEQMTDLPADPGTTKRRPPSPPPAAAGAGTDPDVLRIVHELERRMGQLEAKLAEANEARERLERQVAAQSEELRVQRAAIARTQRALRTMSRGDEEKATEPALRDGDTQARTRINV